MKKSCLFIFLLVSIQFSIFSISLKTKCVLESLNGEPINCLGSFGVSFFDDTVFFISDIRYININRISENGEFISKNDFSIKNTGRFPAYDADTVTYELKHGYKVVLSSIYRSIPIIMRNPDKITEPSMFNHGDFRPIPYFLYIKDKNDNIVFDLNKYRLDHEEFYPKGHYTSTSRYEEFSKDEARRQLSNDLAWTMYQGCTAVNRKQNRIAIILNQYNVYEDALCVFEILYDAVCNDDKVRVRKEPNLECETICLINKNDSVKIKDQSDRKFEINGEKWYWHEVETPDGTTGWVYGKYLDIEE